MSVNIVLGKTLSPLTKMHLKGLVTSKFCHHLFTLMFFQICDFIYFKETKCLSVFVQTIKAVGPSAVLDSIYFNCMDKNS